MAITVIASGLSAAAYASTTTSPANTTGANLIVLGAATWSASATVSDSAGNTWTALAQQAESGGTHAQLFYCFNPTTSSAHTFTLGDNDYPTLGYLALSGVDTGTAPVQAAGANSGSATSIQPGSLTPAAAGALLVTCLDSLHGTANVIDSGFSSLTNDWNTSTNGNVGGGIGWLIQGAAAPANPTWSWTGTFAAATVMATFAAAASAAPPIPIGWDGGFGTAFEGGFVQ